MNEDLALHGVALPRKSFCATSKFIFHTLLRSERKGESESETPDTLAPEATSIAWTQSTL